MSDSHWWPDGCGLTSMRMPMDMEMIRPAPVEFMIPVRFGGLDIRRPSALVQVTEATQASGDLKLWHRTVAKLMTSIRRSAYGPRAPVRRRPKRLAKKIAKRGGYLQPGSVGAFMSTLGIRIVFI